MAMGIINLLTYSHNKDPVDQDVKDKLETLTLIMEIVGGIFFVLTVIMLGLKMKYKGVIGMSSEDAQNDIDRIVREKRRLV